MAEVYPLGGAGDRLGLVDETTGESLPAALLMYNGRTLIEGLLRDLSAREWLYYKLHGEHHVTPVAIMTSAGAVRKPNENSFDPRFAKGARSPGFSTLSKGLHLK